MCRCVTWTVCPCPARQGQTRRGGGWEATGLESPHQQPFKRLLPHGESLPTATHALRPARHAWRRRTRRLLVLVALAILGALAWSLWSDRPAPAATESVQPGGGIAAQAAAPADPAPAVTGDRAPPDSAPPKMDSGGNVSVPQERPKWQTYQVREGDTLGEIAAHFGLQLWTLEAANNLQRDELLPVGQELTIPAVDGVLHRVQAGDTMWDIAALHGVDVERVVGANADVEPGGLPLDYLVLVPGGRPLVRPALLASRGGAGGTLARSQPSPASAEGNAAAPSAGAAPPAAAPGDNTVPMQWPLRGEITDGFGWRVHPVYGTPSFHEGIDIAADEGTPIRAAAGGTVTRASTYGGWGLTVELNHGGGLVTRYSHASSLLVTTGDRVETGQEIARVGNTGVSTGPHLDFGVYVDGKPQDPLDWLP